MINYRAKDVSSALSAAVPEGLDGAVDGVGGNLQDIIISHLKPGATMLQIGYIAEYPHMKEGKYLIIPGTVDETQCCV